MPPLVKWTGGKRSQAGRIAAMAPWHQRYIEPFLGGGAVLFHLAHRGAIAADQYAPLIGLWKLAQQEPETLIRHYREKWQQIGERGHEVYYEVRESFNRTADPLDLNLLLRTCVNGIVRFNREGRFNNSFHLSRRGMQPDRFAQVVSAWNAGLQGVSLRVADFRETVAEATPDDFIYLDPPYAGTRQRYESRFDPAVLFAELERLNRLGARWALSYDGQRAGRDLSTPCPVPADLYRRRLLLSSGLSAVSKVLNGPLEAVEEALYLNYEPPS